MATSMHTVFYKLARSPPKVEVLTGSNLGAADILLLYGGHHQGLDPCAKLRH